MLGQTVSVETGCRARVGVAIAEGVYETHERVGDEIRN